MAKDEFIPVNEPLLDGKEGLYLQECIDTGWISSEGPFVGKFEAQFASSVQQRYGIAVTNGTAAVDVAIAALKIGPGDEVILPTFTIISCVLQLVRVGAVPVLVDADPITWNMDVSQIEAKITKRTKAILAVHIYGLPVDMRPLLALANAHGLAVVEDAAEAIGQTYEGSPCGGLGDLGTFSFYPNKHITTGEGGMVTTNREDLAFRCRALRNLCFQPEKRFVHEELGWNLRMTNLQAALGLAQLEKLSSTVATKRAMGDRYASALSAVEGLQLPLAETEYARNTYWVFGVVVDPIRKKTAIELMGALGKANIGTRPFFYPMHLQPVLRKMGLFEGERYPVAERLAEYGFYVPSGVALTESQIERVSMTLRKLLS